MFEEFKSAVGYSATGWLEADRTKRSRIKLASLSMFGNLVCWCLALLLPDQVAEVVKALFDISDLALKSALAIPLIFAFLSTYSLLRAYYSTVGLTEIGSEEMMSGYRDHLERERHRNIILISGAAGGLNILLLSLTVVWFH